MLKKYTDKQWDWNNISNCNNLTLEWLKKYPPLQGKIKSIKTAILWKKAKSTFKTCLGED